MSELALFLAFVGVLVAGATVFALVQRAKRRRIRPTYWVGVTAYEGDDETAAKAAYAELQNQLHTLPGAREWMQGDVTLKTFKVV